MDYKEYFEKEYEFLPWNGLNEDERKEQEDWQRALKERYAVSFGKDSVISPHAFLYSVEGSFGEKTLIGSHALLRSLQITAGDNCSFNSYCVVHGKVKLGDNVRIAPGAKIFGENHGFSDLTKPICTQPNTRRGIVIEDDVWIGANSVICDGAKIGKGCIVGAGATVTGDIPPYSIVGGVPARVIKNRLAERKNSKEFISQVDNFAAWIKENADRIVSSHFENGEYVNSKTDREKRRAVCDSVEIMAMFSSLPSQLTKDDIRAKIREVQKDENEYESVLSASYALEILGEKPIRFTFAEKIDAFSYLDSLKWATDAWDAGHFTDIYATACYFNKKYYSYPTPVNLFLWLSLNQCTDGLWGEGDINLRVNGYYRLTRGSYDQFKFKPHYVKEAVDTVLSYAAKKGVPQNACDALDIIHPLYFLKGFTNYRVTEGEAWCVEMLPKFLRMALDTGFPFEKGGEPSLKGTEMWLAIIYLMCDYLGIANRLGYEPKGVHRTK